MIGPTAPTDYPGGGTAPVAPRDAAPPTPQAPAQQQPPSLIGMNTFANAIKAKYPAYKNVDNTTLTQKMLAKYPQYASIVHQASPETQKLINTPTPSQSVAGNFVKALPSAALQVGVGGPVKLGASLKEGILSTLQTGGKQNASGETYHVPGLEPFKSFQSEANDRAQKGQNPLLNVGQGAFDVGTAGADTIGLLDGATKLPKLLSKIDVRAGGAAAERASQAITDEATKNALDITKPVMNKKLAISTLKQSGKVSSMGETAGAQEPTLFKNVKSAVTNKDTEVANSVKHLVSTNNSPVKNITNINQEIGRVASKEIEPGLKANPIGLKLSTPSAGGVVNRIKAIEPPRLIKSDATLNNTYNQVKELMLEKIAENSKNANAIDSHGLWKARIAFRSAAEDQFGAAIYNPEKNSAVKQAIRDVADKANEIVGEANPKFRPQMKQLSNMYSARDNIAESNYKLLTGQSSKAASFVKNHPLLSKVGGSIVGGAAAEEVTRHFLGR